MPNQSAAPTFGKCLFQKTQIDESLQASAKKIVNMMNNFLNMKTLEQGPTPIQNKTELVRSPDSVLDNLADNYLIISKKDISGISGHLCNRCLSFQFRYIKDILYDRTAEEKHQCLPELVKYARNMKESRKMQILEQLGEKATHCIMGLTDSIFGDKKKIVILSSVYSYAQNLHAPKISTKSIGDIVTQILSTDERSKFPFKDFISLVGGTYALISYPNERPGYRLAYIKRS